MAQIDSLIRLVDRVAPPDSVDGGVRRLTGSLSRRLNVVLDEIPNQEPSLARGATIYQKNCTGCHGSLGAGDGPLAKGLEPPPANLTDHSALRDQSPLDYYRRITIGVVGTAMPAFETRLSPTDPGSRGVCQLLRLPSHAGNVPAALQSFATSGRMSDTELLPPS